MIKCFKRTASHLGCLHTFLLKKPQTLLSNVQLIRFHITKVGIYMKFKQKNPH